MVRLSVLLLLFISFSHASILSTARTFLDQNTYKTQRNLINVLFSNKDQYTNKLTGHIDTLKIVKTLKTNGLLKLSYSSAKQLELFFDVSNHPLLSMKIINNILQSLGYTYYLTSSIHKHGDNLRWKIVINTQNLVDPIIFSNMLQQRNCSILHISKDGEFSWSYEINTKDAKLKTTPLQKSRTTVLPKPNRAYWFDVQGGKTLSIEANKKDHWHPMVSFFDKKLNTLYEINMHRKRRLLKVKIPKNIKYIKVDDKYLLNNIKRVLVIRLD